MYIYNFIHISLPINIQIQANNKKQAEKIIKALFASPTNYLDSFKYDSKEKNVNVYV